MTNFFLLGVGEWQAYAARFWPTVMLLLVVLFVAKRRNASDEIKWMAVTFTALLPTISVGLRAGAYEYFARIENVRAALPLQWYISDLRPDLLLAVLLVWTVVPIIEYVKVLNRWNWVLSGTFAALAILTKASFSPGILLAWLGVMVGSLLLNRHQLRPSIEKMIWACVPFTIILAPFVAAGGLRGTWLYIYQNALGPESVFWALPNPTFVNEITYYWALFPTHLGDEGLVLVCVGIVICVNCFRRHDLNKHSSIFYLGLSAALWLAVSVNPAKNFFLGLPYYLLLWLFSFGNVMSFLSSRVNRRRMIRVLLLVLLISYTGFCVVGGLYAYAKWPPNTLSAAERNRSTTLEISRDLRGFLSDNDTFFWAPAYGYPGTLQFYMMDRSGGFPRAVYINMSETPARFVEKELSECKAVLAYDQDIQLVVQIGWVPPQQYPYYRAIAQWVENSTNGFTVVRTYTMIADTGPLTLRLYLKSNNPITSQPSVPMSALNHFENVGANLKSRAICNDIRDLQNVSLWPLNPVQR
jgi:hypothetical protein